MRLALIPARGGSKRIPRKNLRLFAGRPVIAHSISTARETGLFDRIVVSTDDAEIADVARQHGADVPFMRPPDLADDQATTMAVVKHAVQWLAAHGQEAAEFCCIYATAPFIQKTDLAAAKALMDGNDADYCVPVTSFPFPIQRAVRLTREGRMEMFAPDRLTTRSQDLEEAYHDAGQFYWGRTGAVLDDVPIFGSRTVPLIIPRWRVQDIDTPEDWERAELLYEILKRQGRLG